MPLTIPPGVDALGRRNAIWAPTNTLSVASLTSTGVELICYLTKGTLGFAAETDKGTDERECSIQTFEVLGQTKWTLQDLEYVWEPQDTAGTSVTNKAYNTLAPLTAGFLNIRFGILNDTALTVGDLVWQFPVTVGMQVPKAPDTSNPAEKLKIVQTAVVTGNIRQDVALIT